MKKLFQTKETSASGVKRCGRVLSLIVALTALAGSVYAQQTYQAYLNNTQQASCWSGGGFSWLPAQTPDGSNNVSWTIDAKQYENYIYFSKSGSVDDIINMPSTVTVNDPQGLLYRGEKCECSSKIGVCLNFKEAATGITLTYNVSSKAVTVSGEVVTKYSINASGTGCTISPASISVNEGSFATFTMTPEAGYSYASYTVTPSGAATVTKEGNTFRVTPTANCTFSVVCSQKSYNVTTLLTEGSITPTSATVSHGGIQTFTVTIPGGKQFDKTATNYSGTAEISYNDNKITLSNVTSAGVLEVAFSSDVTPIVFWEKYPTLGANSVNLYGYLAERYCTTVTAAGFYWSKSPITDKAAAIAAIGNGNTSKEYVIPATAFKKPDGTAATLATMENGFSFSAENAELNPSLTEATTIYLVNYLKTDGNMAISDMVALVYEPCFPVESVTLNNSAVSLPEGYKFTFEALARSAGKNPVYEWYLDGNKIDGATSSIYEFTMDAAASHSLKVKVTGDCSSFEEATAIIESCTVPEITLDATPASATPWVTVAITANGAEEQIGTGLWSVTPDAELNNGTPTGVTFRAGTPGTYTVKYVGISDECTAADVRVEAEKEITVSADSEDCENPNAN
ncbi:MAG: hypothetical protein MJ009_05700 [Paludibacteraceae bacterium]|nr:hypothetical protein [Paludibacteraceae bacterium]